MFLFVAAALIAADQLTKLWASNVFPLGGEERYIGLGFYFTFVQNSGAAFGILQDGTLVLGILSAVVSAVLLVYLLLNRHKLTAFQTLALTLIFSGAVGNMIDRFRLGYVIDFIHFQIPSFNFPVFNVADSCVVIGAGLLLIASFFHQEPEQEVPADSKQLGDIEFFQNIETEK